MTKFETQVAIAIGSAFLGSFWPSNTYPPASTTLTTNCNFVNNSLEPTVNPIYNFNHSNDCAYLPDCCNGSALHTPYDQNSIYEYRSINNSTYFTCPEIHIGDVKINPEEPYYSYFTGVLGTIMSTASVLYLQKQESTEHNKKLNKINTQLQSLVDAPNSNNNTKLLKQITLMIKNIDDKIQNVNSVLDQLKLALTSHISSFNSYAKESQRSYFSILKEKFTTAKNYVVETLTNAFSAVISSLKNFFQPVTNFYNAYISPHLPNFNNFELKPDFQLKMNTNISKVPTKKNTSKHSYILSSLFSTFTSTNKRTSNRP